MIQFLNPLMLAGLAAVALPVIVHLLHRRRSRQVWFPSLMFLLRIDARTMRRKRLREWILLASRCLLLALLALAAARPVLAERQAAGGNTSLVLVLDTSRSMTCRQENVTRFRRAQETALRALDSLSLGDRAAVLTPGDGETASLTSDLGLLRHRIRSVEAGFGAEGLRATVDRSVRLLAEAPESNRELLLLTDLQARAVSGLEGLAVPDGVRLLVADHGADVATNLAIVDVATGEGTAVVGNTITIAATVAADGAQAASSQVSLYIGAERFAMRTASVGAGQRATVAFEVTPDRPGDLSARVALDGDVLPADDERWIVVPVLGRVDVLAVNGDPSPTPWLDEVFVLRAALDPTGLGEVDVTTPFRLTVVEPEELGTRDLGPFRAVILANVGEIAREAALRLAAFVRSGGGLLVFAGSRMTEASARRTFGPEGPAAGCLPRLPGRPLAGAGDAAALPRLAPPDTSHPVLRGLDPAFLEDLVRVRCVQALDLSGEEGRDLVRFEDGRPFLVEGEAGGGRVLQFAVSADPDWSNLPKRPVFVALLHRALFHLIRGATGRSDRLVGEPIPVRAPAGGTVEVYSPDRPDDPVRFTDAERGEGGFEDTARPGLYRCVTRSGGGASETVVAVNVDPAESDLSRWSVEALESALAEGLVRTISVDGDVAGELRRARRGRPIWGVLLGLALAVLLVEAVLANRWARPPVRLLREEDGAKEVTPGQIRTPELARAAR